MTAHLLCTGTSKTSDYRDGRAVLANTQPKTTDHCLHRRPQGLKGPSTRGELLLKRGRGLQVTEILAVVLTKPALSGT